MQRSAPEHTATMAVMDSRQVTAPLRLRAGVSVLSSPWHGFGKGGPSGTSGCWPAYCHSPGNRKAAQRTKANGAEPASIESHHDLQVTKPPRSSLRAS